MIRGVLYYIIGLALFLFIVMFLSNCATPNPAKQKKHYDKFVYYGGKIDTVEKTVTITQVVKGKDGKDSLIYVDVTVPCPEATIKYKDRWHTRRMDKQERDSFKHAENMLKLEIKRLEKQGKTDVKVEKEKTNQAKSDARTAKYENKSSGWNNPMIWVIMLVALAISIYLIKRT
jgi:hypothetical protein